MLNWFGRSKATIDELIARKKYSQAIDAMRRQFRQKLPDASERYRYAEVLILADRWLEAVPVLLGLADEHARYGLFDKAREALLRIEHVEPGRSEVARRLSDLARREKAKGEARADGPPARGREEKDEPVGDGSWTAEPISEPQPALADASAEDEACTLEFVRELVRGAEEEAGRTGRPVLAAALFDGLDDDRIRPLLPGLHRRAFAAGDLVLTEGEPGETVFLVASGSVKVFVRSPHGRNFEVDTIDAPGFFGEVGALSSRRREASVVAASACTLVEIEKRTLDALALCRPVARQLLEETCVERATSPAAAAVRAVPEDVAVERAAVALAEHFGESRWSARMRLRLADLLLKAGNEKDALAILTAVAEDLAAAGRAEKAIAVLQKIQKIARREVEELCLAPLVRAEPQGDAGDAPEEGPRQPAPEEAFRGWLFHVLGELRSAANEEAGDVRLDLAPLRRPAAAPVH